MRQDGRRPDELRRIKITPGFLTNPPGSCLIEMGGTRVVCSAMVEPTVPYFLKGSGKGWLSAEYSMIPGSSGQRVSRERSKLGGRTSEIQRLIGRSLRSCVDLSALGERSVVVDCDVLDADGGTRTAAITGGYVALALALRKLSAGDPSLARVLRLAVAAVSVGVIRGEACLDLPYEEDKDAEVDMNVVKTSDGRFIEVQGTAETNPFDRGSLNRLLDLAENGLTTLFEAQKRAFPQ